MKSNEEIGTETVIQCQNESPKSRTYSAQKSTGKCTRQNKCTYEKGEKSLFSRRSSSKSENESLKEIPKRLWWRHGDRQIIEKIYKLHKGVYHELIRHILTDNKHKQ